MSLRCLLHRTEGRSSQSRRYNWAFCIRAIRICHVKLDGARNERGYMSITLTVGPDSPIEMSKLKGLEHEVKSIFDLGVHFHAYLDGQISSLPDDVRSTTIGYSGGNSSWSAGDFGFSVGAGLCGKISVYPSGKLFSYPNGFDTEVMLGELDAEKNKAKVEVLVPEGMAYVCLELEFQIQGGISATAASGTFGVCGSIDASDTFSVAFSKQCKATDILRDGIHAAFTDFVLPLHAETFAGLQQGDYLRHNFNANLQVGLGASVGIAKVFYAGKCAADIPGMRGAIHVSGELKPQVQLGAKLAYHLDYAATFEAILWKDSETVGHIHLLRCGTQSSGLGLTLGLTLATEPTVSATLVAEQAKAAISRLLPGAPANKINAGISNSVGNALSGFVSDSTEKLSDWLQAKVADRLSLQVALEKVEGSALLMDYTFDLTASAYAASFALAIQGRYADALALANGGVSIATGSGMEKLYSDKTSVHVNLFGLAQATRSTEVISNSTLVYAGNNIFHLIADVGAKDAALLGKSKSEIDLYFALEANISGNADTHAKIGLHALLKATDNATFGAHIAQVIGLLNLGDAGTQIVSAIQANSGVAGSTQTLHLILEESAYAQLRSSTLSGGKPDDQAPDQANFAAFAKASSDLTLTPPASFECQGQAMTYGIWSTWNIACNDQYPPPVGAVPNRTSPGNTIAGNGYLQLQFPNIGTYAPLVGYTLKAASDFMNFCEDLKTLATADSIDGGMAAWPKFVAHLKAIITSDVPADFIVPIALALTRLCGTSTVTKVKGPAPAPSPEKSCSGHDDLRLALQRTKHRVPGEESD